MWTALMRVPGRTQASLALAALSMATTAAAAPHFQQTNLVTDDQAALGAIGFSAAVTVDPALINPWGISYAPSGPFWISNQGSGTSTLYNGAGVKIPLTVTILGAEAGPSGPTGQVFYGGSGFKLSNGNPGRFFFANLNGSISGWNPGAGTTTTRVAPMHEAPAIYTGLAIGETGGNIYLYAVDESGGGIKVFDQNFASATLAGNFVDPGPNPEGLRPFNAQNLGGKLYVTYAVAGANQDEAALGSGFVSVFNLDGTFDRRLASGGQLSSPWGLAIAPGSFGALAGSLLVGNFSDTYGHINAFSLSDGSFLGALGDGSGNPYTIPYLWGLTVGNNGNAGSSNQLYFAAGIGDEQHGLFGTFAAVPEPATWVTMLSGIGMVGGAVRRRKMRSVAA